MIVQDTKLFNVVVSFGSVTSSISLPCYMSHASIPAAVRAARGLPDDLVRISAGIEDVGDLIAGAVLCLEIAWICWRCLCLCLCPTACRCPAGRGQMF